MTISPVPTLPDSGTPLAPTTDASGAGESSLPPDQELLKQRAIELGWQHPSDGVYRTHPDSNSRWLDGTPKVKPWSKRQAEYATQDDALSIATMTARGGTTRTIARRLGLKEHVVKDILANPDVQGYVKTLRDMTKTIAAEGALAAQRQGYRWLKKVARNRGDAKEFAALTSGLASLERISASASGELKPQVNVQTAVVNTDTATELKELLAKLSGG